MLYLQFFIPWFNIEYYDIPSKNFLEIEDGVKQALQSIIINDNPIERLNLHQFEKFVQIVKWSND